MIQNGVAMAIPASSEGSGWGVLCVGDSFRSARSLSREERGYHFERREYGFNFRHVPDSMRDQLLKRVSRKESRRVAPFFGKRENCPNQVVSSFFQIILQIFFKEAFFGSSLELGEKKGKSSIPGTETANWRFWSWFSTFQAVSKGIFFFAGFSEIKEILPLKASPFSQGIFEQSERNRAF